jgi:hypothetical protein
MGIEVRGHVDEERRKINGYVRKRKRDRERWKIDGNSRKKENR